MNINKSLRVLLERADIYVEFQVLLYLIELGSARRVREFLYHPDDIKSFKTGNGIYMSKDSGTHSKITIYKPF